MAFELFIPRKIGSLGKVVTGKTPATTVSENFDGPYPFITIPDLGGQQRIRKSARTLSEVGAKSQKTLLLPAGAVLMSCIATVGKTGITTVPSFTNQQINAVICDETQVAPAYLYYAFSALRPQLEDAGGGGSIYTNVSKSRFSDLTVYLPPTLAEQNAIASVLGALDDRIENLRATNETLEAIVQTLFKSWFVDFDPVKAKAAGKAPVGMDAETAALFPSEFEESELGLIPKGWAVCRVDQVAAMVKGKSYTSAELVDTNGTALVTLKSFKRGGGFRLDGFKPYAGKYKEEQVVIPGDLIVAYTDVTQAAELIGRPAIVVGVDAYRTLVASLDVGIVRPKFETMSRQFLKGLFSTPAFEYHTKARASGTTVLHLAKNAVEEFRFACPIDALSQKFAEIADPLSATVQRNIDEAYSFESLRDSLLPKLISGELRLSEFGDD